MRYYGSESKHLKAWSVPSNPGKVANSAIGHNTNSAKVSIHHRDHVAREAVSQAIWATFPNYHNHRLRRALDPIKQIAQFVRLWFPARRATVSGARDCVPHHRLKIRDHAPQFHRSITFGPIADIQKLNC